MPACSVASSAEVAKQRQRPRKRGLQQAVPAAGYCTVAGNWCLRSPRVRRAGQARASLPYPAPPSLCAAASAGRAREAFECNQSRSVGERSDARGASGQAAPHIFRLSQRQLARPVGQELAGGQQERGHQFKGRAVRAFCRSSVRFPKPAWQLQNPATVGLAQNPMANPSTGTSR